MAAQPSGVSTTPPSLVSSPRAQETRQEATASDCREGNVGKRPETLPHRDESVAVEVTNRPSAAVRNGL